MENFLDRNGGAEILKFENYDSIVSISLKSMLLREQGRTAVNVPVEYFQPLIKAPLYSVEKYTQRCRFAEMRKFWLNSFLPLFTESWVMEKVEIEKSIGN